MEFFLEGNTLIITIPNKQSFGNYYVDNHKCSRQFDSFILSWGWIPNVSYITMIDMFRTTLPT